ncbi:exonuclease 3'-5' domain-containing protein 2 isoform X2 [Engraulis encrasicolus]|uniref:exonuclease 3'-5' domain-containing protein 2 isoform X2 n=1 Tax=Engraulis encrasicolus TaxID=184585 RepID=UPI002FCF63E7
MSRQSSMVAAMATVFGATLGGLILWRTFLTQRKKLTQGPSPPPLALLATPQKQPLQDRAPKQLSQSEKQQQPTPPQQQQLKEQKQEPEEQHHSAAQPQESPQVAVPGTPELLSPPPSLASPPPASLPSTKCLLGVTPVVVSSAEEWDSLWPSLQQDLAVYPVLGLDCEWVSMKGKPCPVSLLQLATYTGQCALIRLHLLLRPAAEEEEESSLHTPGPTPGPLPLPLALPSTLAELLSDLHVLKVGVGCYEDGKRLAHDHGLVLRRTVDLRFLAMRLRHVPLTNGLSLKSLASDLLDISLDKSLHLRCSDWEAEELSPEQVSYAAHDAQVSVVLFFHLLASSSGSTPTTPSPSGAPDSPVEPSPSPSEAGSAYSQLASRCQGLLDVPFRGRSTTGSQEGERKRQSISSSCNRPKLLLPSCMDSPDSPDQRMTDPRKNKRKPLGAGYSARRSPLYDNCFLHAPDGQPLCTCDRKKAQWYIDKGIGVLKSEEPFVVRLLFEPSGRPETQQDYYLTAKQNLCVVCGKADSYIRKKIVPHEYRRYFPAEIKDHNCHDILLLCTACHAVSCTYDGQLKQELAQEHGAPQGCEEGVRLLEDPERRRVRSAARALLTARDGLPDARRQELLDQISIYMQQQEGEEFDTVTQEIIQKAANLETRIFNEDYVPHGLKVVTAFAKRGLRGLMELEVLWRQHFLRSMQPRHLPPLWSVSHNHDKYLRKYGEDLAIELSNTNTSTCSGSSQPASPCTPPPEVH